MHNSNKTASENNNNSNSYAQCTEQKRMKQIITLRILESSLFKQLIKVDSKFVLRAKRNHINTWKTQNDLAVLPERK